MIDLGVHRIAAIAPRRKQPRDFRIQRRSACPYLEPRLAFGLFNQLVGGGVLREGKATDARRNYETNDPNEPCGSRGHRTTREFSSVLCIFYNCASMNARFLALQKS